MKKILLLAMTLCCGIAFNGSLYSQVTVDFETADTGYSLSASEGTSGSSTDIFNRTNPNIGGNSTFIFAAEDLSLSNPTLTIDQIDVSGESSFTFSIDFLTPNSIDWDSTDELLITYSLDGGSTENLMWVQHIPNDASNEPAALDLAFDGDGDVGQELPAIVDGSSVGVSSDFETFTSSAIALSSNTTLDITLQFNNLTSSDEGIYLDNISVSSGVFASATLESVGFDTPTSEEDETNSSFETLIPVTLINYDGAQVDLSVSVTGGTADAADYTLNTSSLSFTSSTSQNISIDINPDLDIDSETIEITIAETSGTGATISSPIHTISITDDDTPDLLISEIMYNSTGTDDEWIEIYNGEGSSVDVSAWTIEVNGSLVFTFPGSTSLSDGSYTTIALGSDGDGTYNNDNPFTPDFAHAAISADVANTTATNVLSNSSSRTISFVTDGGATVGETLYGQSDDSRTNGSGPTYEIIDLTADNSTTASNWQASAVDGGSPGAFSSVTVWDGATDDDWTNAANWSNGVPDESVNAIIATGSNFPSVDSDQAVNDLTINSGQIVLVNSGGGIAIFDQVTNNGSYSIDRSSVGSGGYSILSSPVTSINISDLSDADYAYSFDGTDYSANLSGTATNMNDGQGYFIGSDAASPSMTFFGTPNTGTSVYGVTSGNFELVGNPYSAAISISDFLADNTGTINAAVYFWDDGGSNVGGNRGGDFITTNGMGSASAVEPDGVSDGVTGGQGISGAESGYITSGQGFYVEAAATANVLFTQDMQVSTTGANADANHYRKVDYQKVKLAIAGNGLYNEILVGLGEDATLGRDAHLDAKKLVSENTLSFYSLIDEEKMVIQGLPLATFESVSTPLGFDLAEAGTFSMSVVDFDGVAENVSVTLHDKVTGLSYDLRAIDSFDFTSEITSNDQRFYLEFSPNEILSVNDLSSELNVVGNVSTLTIQSSFDGLQEVVIHALDGKVAFKESVRFSNNNVTINPSLTQNKVYVLRVGDQSFKFVIQ